MSNIKSNIAALWECKECARAVEDEHSVAFHLIDGFLYGWCRDCFNSSLSKRVQQIVARPQEKAA